jgi:hypothetical protein
MSTRPSLALALANSDGPGPCTPRVSSLALVFAEAMGRFHVLAAANSRAADVSEHHAERTAVCYARAARAF